MIPFPIIQGHENIGTIAALGSPPSGRPWTDFDGQLLHVGDRVVVGANVVCGDCYYCRHDFPYFACENMTDYGNNLSRGHAAAPVRGLVRVHLHRPRELPGPRA